jgi:hypothetical protein
LATALLALPALADKTMYVNTRYAKLRDGKTSASKEVVKLAYGEAVTVRADDGSFAQVITTAKVAGFVAKQWLADNLPSRNQTAEGLGEAARAGTGGVSYTAGARGLSSEAETYAAGKADAATAIAAVKQMEAFVVRDDQLDAFLKTGRLGEYQYLQSACLLQPQVATSLATPVFYPAAQWRTRGLK